MNLLSNYYLLDHLKTLNVTSNWLGICVNNPVIIIAVEMISNFFVSNLPCWRRKPWWNTLWWDDDSKRKKNVDGMFPCLISFENTSVICCGLPSIAIKTSLTATFTMNRFCEVITVTSRTTSYKAHSKESEVTASLVKLQSR